MLPLMADAPSQVDFLKTRKPPEVLLLAEMRGDSRGRFAREFRAQKERTEHLPTSRGSLPGNSANLRVEGLAPAPHGTIPLPGECSARASWRPWRHAASPRTARVQLYREGQWPAGLHSRPGLRSPSPEVKRVSPVRRLGRCPRSRLPRDRPTFLWRLATNELPGDPLLTPYQTRCVRDECLATNRTNCLRCGEIQFPPPKRSRSRRHQTRWQSRSAEHGHANESPPNSLAYCRFAAAALLRHGPR